MSDFLTQPCARFVIHQSLTTTVVQIVRLSKLTLSPDEDLQCAVETLRSMSIIQSDNRETNHKTKPFILSRYIILAETLGEGMHCGNDCSKKRCQLFWL